MTRGISRIFQQMIKALPRLCRLFHGMEDAIEHIVSFFRQQPRVWKKRKNRFPFLLGRWGGGKTLAGRETSKGTDAAGALLRHQDSPVF